MDILSSVHPSILAELLHIRSADNDLKMKIEMSKVHEEVSDSAYSSQETPMASPKLISESDSRSGYPLSISSADFTACAKPLSDLDEIRSIEVELLEKLHVNAVKSPPWYYCDRCGLRGDHYIYNCPRKYLLNNPNTPYQGSKRSVGEFTCSQCKRKWMSWFCFTGKTQICRNCCSQVSPKKMFAFEMAIDLRLPGFEHQLKWECTNYRDSQTTTGFWH